MPNEASWSDQTPVADAGVSPDPSAEATTAESTETPIESDLVPAQPGKAKEAKAVNRWQAVTHQVGKKAGDLGENFGQVAAKTGQALAQVGEQTGQTVAKTGQSVAKTGKALLETAGTVGQALNYATHQTTRSVGHALNFLSDNPLLARATAVIKADWLLPLIGQVDIQKAATEAQKLQTDHPNETSAQIAHRLMVKKTLLAGGTGLASSLVPGAAAALFAVDLTATIVLQAEMVYQIAAIYGLDLEDPARKGEVLAIFGLSVGGHKALQSGLSLASRAGLSFLENIPVAGALIGTSSNALMTYALGYAACRFYEAQVSPLESESALTAAEDAAEQYLAGAIAQQRIMDQILAHVIVAAYPEKRWDEIAPELNTLSLSEASAQIIAQHIETPEPLEPLLEKLQADFVVPLLAQCDRIVQLDNLTTAAEQAILNQLQTRGQDLGIEPAVLAHPLTQS